MRSEMSKPLSDIKALPGPANTLTGFPSKQIRSNFVIPEYKPVLQSDITNALYPRLISLYRHPTNATSRFPVVTPFISKW